MEIISRGIPPSEKEYTATCPHCKTVYKFKGNEGTMSYSQREGDSISTRCPVCSYAVSTDVHPDSGSR